MALNVKLNQCGWFGLTCNGNQRVHPQEGVVAQVALVLGGFEEATVAWPQFWGLSGGPVAAHQKSNRTVGRFTLPSFDAKYLSDVSLNTCAELHPTWRHDWEFCINNALCRCLLVSACNLGGRRLTNDDMADSRHIDRQTNSYSR